MKRKLSLRDLMVFWERSWFNLIHDCSLSPTLIPTSIFLFLKKRFTYFVFGCAGCLLLRGLFSSCEQGPLCSCGAFSELLFAVASLMGTGSRHLGFRSCSAWPQWLQFLGSKSTGSKIVVQGLSCSITRRTWTRDQTCASCIGKWTLYH